MTEIFKFLNKIVTLCLTNVAKSLQPWRGWEKNIPARKWATCLCGRGKKTAWQPGMCLMASRSSTSTHQLQMMQILAWSRSLFVTMYNENRTADEVDEAKPLEVLWCHCTYKVIPCAARETWYIPSCLYLGPSNHMSNAYREPCLLGTEPCRHVVWTTLRPIAQSCPQLTKRLNVVEDANAHWSTLCLLWIGLYLIYAWQLSKCMIWCLVLINPYFDTKIIQIGSQSQSR